MNSNLSAKFDQVCTIIDKYGRDPNNLIFILQKVQQEYTYLPEEIMAYIATALGISLGRVYSVATFYSYFTLEPKGKYVIKVCDGTACHVKRSEEILAVLDQDFGLNAGSKTSEDMLFTLEPVACLGTCGLAPVVMINDDVYGSMTGDKMTALLGRIREEELGHAGTAES